MTERKVYKMKKEEKPFICVKCGRGFAQDRYLQNHLNKTVSCDKKHTCPKCNKEFPSNSALSAHLNRITSCVPEEIPIIDITKNEHRCQYCNKTYSNKQNLKRHQLTCDKETNLQHVMKIMMEQNQLLMGERQQDRQQIMQLQQHLISNGINPVINITNNVQNNNVQQNNIYVNVSIVPFGEEDYNKLDHARVLEIIKGNAADFIPQMIEHIHADPKRPEFHNVFYDKQSQAMIKYAAISAEIKTWIKTDPKTVSTQISNRLTKFIHPLNSPYFNDVLKTNDTETANKIINLSNSREDPFEKNIEALAILPKNPNFMNQVRVQELTETEGVEN